MLRPRELVALIRDIEIVNTWKEAAMNKILQRRWNIEVLKRLKSRLKSKFRNS